MNGLPILTLLSQAGINVNFVALLPLLPLLNKSSAEFDISDAHVVLGAMGFDPKEVDPELVHESVAAIKTSDLDKVSTVLSRDEFLIPFVKRLMKSRNREADQLELESPYVAVKCHGCGHVTDIHRTDVRADYGDQDEFTVRCSQCGDQRVLEPRSVRYFGV